MEAIGARRSTRLRDALAATRLSGIETNRDYLQHVLDSDAFREGRVHTRMLEDMAYQSATFEVLEPGTQTTVQDYPGRIGYWDVGIPPSGPMDPLSFQLANRLLGNPVSAALLECTLVGPDAAISCSRGDRF